MKGAGTTATALKYILLTETLQEQLRSLPPNSLLPGEQQLAKRFMVSRITVRRALGILERSGRVSRVRGRGTIVSAPKISRRIVPARTIDQDFREQGIKLETRVLAYEPRVTASEPVRERLQLSRRATAGHLMLARLVDDQIICHDRRYLPPSLAARFNPVLLKNNTVSDILQQLARRRIAAAGLEMEISAADPDVARTLGIVPGMLIAINSFTEYLGNGEPLEFGVMSYRVDRVKFWIAQREPVLRATASEFQSPLTGIQGRDGSGRRDARGRAARGTSAAR